MHMHNHLCYDMSQIVLPTTMQQIYKLGQYCMSRKVDPAQTQHSKLLNNLTIKQHASFAIVNQLLGLPNHYPFCTTQDMPSPRPRTACPIRMHPVLTLSPAHHRWSESHTAQPHPPVIMDGSAYIWTRRLNSCSNA
jgi:hypothetical protein